MRKFSKGLAISTSLAAATMAVAQDTTDNTNLLSSLLGGGVVGILVLALVGFFLFRFFFSSGD